VSSIANTAASCTAFAVNCLGDRGLAEELVQDVFTRVWRHADQYDASKASFRTWLYGIARNAVIDFNRRRSVRPSLAAHEPIGEGEALYDSIDQAVTRWQVAAALERLTPEHREGRPPGPLPGADAARGLRANRPPPRHRQEPCFLCTSRAAARTRGDGGDSVTAAACHGLSGADRGLRPGGPRRRRGGGRTPPPRDLQLRVAREHADLAAIPTLLDMADSADAVPERPPPRLEEAVLDRFAREQRGADAPARAEVAEPASERKPPRARRRVGPRSFAPRSASRRPHWPRSWRRS